LSSSLQFVVGSHSQAAAAVAASAAAAAAAAAPSSVQIASRFDGGEGDCMELKTLPSQVSFGVCFYSKPVIRIRELTYRNTVEIPYGFSFEDEFGSR
jgi:hypothetical protein